MPVWLARGGMYQLVCRVGGGLAVRSEPVAVVRAQKRRGRRAIFSSDGRDFMVQEYSVDGDLPYGVTGLVSCVYSLVG